MLGVVLYGDPIDRNNHIYTMYMCIHIELIETDLQFTNISNPMIVFHRTGNKKRTFFQWGKVVSLLKIDRANLINVSLFSKYDVITM